MTLQSPAGTRVQFVNGDATLGGSADNFNVRADDEATGGVVNANNINHNVVVAPYQFRLNPNNSLSPFDGESFNGTWRLEICDIFPSADNGAFLRADLFLTDLLNLSVSKVSTVISDPINGTTNPKAIPGAVIEYCITITNPSSLDTTAISAADTQPLNTTFISGTMRSGNDCSSAATIEDDNGSGADESDPSGAVFSGGVITITRPTLGPSQTFALTFQVTVN